MSTAVDLFVVYKIIKGLSTPFDETEAFNLGLIDAKGKLLKKAKSQKEKQASTYFDRMIFNMKRLLAKLPGGDNRIKSYAAALLLLREEKHHTLHNLIEEIKYLKSNQKRSLHEFLEDAPANSAGGGGVAGIGVGPDGEPGVHLSKRGIRIGKSGTRKKMGRSISGVQFLKRRMFRGANNVSKAI